MLLVLPSGGGITAYLEQQVEALDNLPEILLAEGKPVHIIEETCMEVLTKNLGPSRFNYLSSLLKEEFEWIFYDWQESGILTYEVLNLLDVCAPLFKHFGFREETGDDRLLRYAVVGAVQEYLEGNS